MAERSPKRTGTDPEISFHSAPVLKMRVVEPLRRAVVPLMVLASVGGAAFAAKQVWAPAGSSLACGSVGDSWRAACREAANGPAKARIASASDPATGMVDETKGKKRSATVKSPEPAAVEVAKLQPEAPAKNAGASSPAPAPLHPVDESRDLAGSIEPLAPAVKPAPAAVIAPAAPPARPVETAAAPASAVKQPEPDRSVAVVRPPAPAVVPNSRPTPAEPDRTTVVARAAEPPVVAPSRPKLSFEAERPVAVRPVEPAPSAPKVETAAPPAIAKKAAPVEVAPPARVRPPAAAPTREARAPSAPDRSVRDLASRETDAPVRHVRPRALDQIEPPARAAQGNAFPPEFLRELRGYNSGYRASLEDRRRVAYASDRQAPRRRLRPGRDDHGFPPEFAQVLRSYNTIVQAERLPLPW